ncbi:MAG: S8 family serine peptidase [Candidatus Omnitrophota bacterium]
MKRINFPWNAVLIVFILLSVNNLCYSLESDNDYKLVSSQYAPNQLIVKLKEGKIPNDIQALNVKYNIGSMGKIFPDIKIPKQTLKGQSQIGSTQASDPHLENIYLIKTEKNIDVVLMAKEYSNNPLVEYAEPNYIYTVQMVPDDPYYSTKGSWGQSYDDLYGLKPDKLNCEAAWDINQGDGVIVAVIDTGVDKSHEDLSGNIWVNEGEIPGNGIDDDGNGYVDDINGWDFVNNDNDPKDDHGHGTHCSGTIAGMGNNGIGVIGVAPKAKIMAVKGLSEVGSGSTEGLGRCVVYAVNNGANVLSNSWGGTGTSSVLTDAFHYAYNNGVIAVASAGNNNMDVKDFQPANIDTIISVAATDDKDLKASFSNWGEVTVAAPGVQILSARSAGTDMYGDGTHIIGDKYYRANGTSMACPHVAGVCALIVGKIPAISPDDLRSILTAGTEDLPNDPVNEKLICGRVNANKSLEIDSSKLCFSKITEPSVLIVSNKDYIDIKALAYGNDFSYYMLDYKNKTAGDWVTIVAEAAIPVPVPTVIGKWDIKELADGDYILRLRVFNNNEPADVFTSSKSIAIDNVAINNLENGIFIPTKSEIEIKGVVCGYEFLNYKFEFKPCSSGVWSEEGLTYDGSTAKPIESVLAVFDSSVIDKTGEYYLKLTANFAGDKTESEIISFYYDLELMEGFPISLPILEGLGYLNVVNKGDGKKNIVVVNDAKILFINSKGELSEIKRTDVIEDYFAFIDSSLSVGDLNNDGKEEIITSVFIDLKPEDKYTLYNKSSAYESDGSLVLGWPEDFGEAPFDMRIYVEGKSTIIDDMDGDGKLEIAMMAYKECEGIGADGKRPEVHLLFILNSDGTVVEGWPIAVTWITDKCRTWTVGPNPAMADINNDGKKEFLVWLPSLGLAAYTKEGEIMEGWQVTDTLQYSKNAINDYYRVSAPVIADLDNDGVYEIIIRDYYEGLYVFDNKGVLIQRLQIDPDALHDYYWGFGNDEITVADLDKDGKLEIIIGLCWQYIDYENKLKSRSGENKGIQIYKYKDKQLELLSFSFPYFPRSNIVVGDTNNDNMLEMIMCHNGTEVAAFNLIGEMLWKKKIGTIQGFADNLILTDLDGDNKVELITNNDSTADIFAWEFESSVIPENMPWPQEGHDPQHTGRVNIIAEEVKKGDINADGRVDVVDVQIIVNIILGIVENPDKKADVNGDGFMDVLDLQMIVNIILELY